MKKTLFLLFLCAGCALAFQNTPVFNDPTITGPQVVIPTIGDPSAIADTYKRLIGNWISTGQSFAGAVFGALALLDLAVYGLKLALARHSFDTALLAATNKLLAIAFFFTLLINGAQWMPQVIDLFVQFGKHASGVTSLGPSEILGQGVKIATHAMWAGMKQLPQGNIVEGIGILVGAIFVMFAFLVIAVQFTIAQVDIYVAVGIASICLMLGGSRWTVEFVQRYFAFCVSAGVKMMAMYLLIGGGWPITANWDAQAQEVGNSWDSVPTGFIIALSGVFFAFVIWHCARMVSSALGGAPNMVGSDFVAFMAAPIAAAVGAASVAATAATGGAAAPAAAAATMTTAGASARSAGNAGGFTSGGSTPPSSPPPAGGGSGAPPSTPPPSSGGGSGSSGAATAGKAALGLAKVGTQFLRSLPPSGHSGGAPPVRGIEH